MKKSTILSFATAAAIVVSTAGTYAVWDKLTATSGDSEFTVNADTTIVTDFTIPTLTEVSSNTDSITYAQEFTVKVDGSATSMDLTPTVTLANGTAIQSEFIEVSMLEGVSPLTNTNNTFTDTGVTANNTYKIQVKVKDASLNNQTLKVKVDANVTK